MNKIIKNPFVRKQKGTVSILCILSILLVGNFYSCAKRGDNPSQGVYYVVGYSSPDVEIRDETAKSGGYLFISENLKDTLFASNQSVLENMYCGICILHDDFYLFPKEIMPKNVCGFAFFPKEYRYAYKVQMTYKFAPEQETHTVLCPANLLVVRTRARHIVITSISKIQ